MGPGIIRPRRLAAWLRAGLCAALAALAIFPHQAFAQTNASAKTAAIILQPGSIVKLTDMRFGSIAVAGAGTVVLPAQAPATCTASANLIHSGACQAASFAVRGRNSQHVRIQDLFERSITDKLRETMGGGGARNTIQPRIRGRRRHGPVHRGRS